MILSIFLLLVVVFVFYKFILTQYESFVNLPDVTGLMYDPTKTYVPGGVAVYNGKLWGAVGAGGLGSTLGVPSSSNGMWNMIPFTNAMPIEFQNLVKNTELTGSPIAGTASGLSDPSCAAGKYSVVTVGPCTGTVDTAAYLQAVNALKPSTPSTPVNVPSTVAPAVNKLSPTLSESEIATLKALAANNTTPNETSWPQKYNGSRSGEIVPLRPGLSDCQKYYNCNTNDGDDGAYEGQCL